MNKNKKTNKYTVTFYQSCLNGFKKKKPRVYHRVGLHALLVIFTVFDSLSETENLCVNFFITTFNKGLTKINYIHSNVFTKCRWIGLYNVFKVCFHHGNQHLLLIIQNFDLARTSPSNEYDDRSPIN